MGSPPYSWIQVKPVQNLALVQSLCMQLGTGEAKERGLISSVRDPINSLRKCNFRISAALEQEVLRMAGE